MNKTNYPVNIINAKKIDRRKMILVNDSISVKKYQNVANKSYSHYKPISKLFNLDN